MAVHPNPLVHGRPAPFAFGRHASGLGFETFLASFLG